MAKWPTVTQIGNVRWILWGHSITNHEVFAFALQKAGQNVGAYIFSATVYVNQTIAEGEPSYNISITAVDQSGSPVNQIITGNFESKAV